MFVARFEMTPDGFGIKRMFSETDRVKSFTHKVHTRMERPTETSQKKVFFVVNKTGEVRCWPYKNFLTLSRQTHPGEVRLANEADLSKINGPLEQYTSTAVEFPQSAADRFVDNMAFNVVRSARAFVEKKANAKRAKKTVKKTKSKEIKLKPKKVSKRAAPHKKSKK